jgi:hypothetical protein
MKYMTDIVKTAHGVLIIPGKVDLGTSKSIKKSTLEIEIFNYKELQFNPTHGVFSARFVKISKDQFNKGDIDRQRRIKEDDIIARHYYFRAGDLLKIYNPNPLPMMAVEEIMYALVVK